MTEGLPERSRLGQGRPSVGGCGEVRRRAPNGDSFGSNRVTGFKAFFNPRLDSHAGFDHNPCTRLPSVRFTPYLGGTPMWKALLIPMIGAATIRSEEHTSELQSLRHLVCRLLLE